VRAKRSTLAEPRTGSRELVSNLAQAVVKRTANNFPFPILRAGLAFAILVTVFQIDRGGDGEARKVYRERLVKGAATEGLFKTERRAGIALFGQPNMLILKVIAQGPHMPAVEVWA
jgi:cytochrome bd-type quinol oxidase subunit 1